MGFRVQNVLRHAQQILAVVEDFAALDDGIARQDADDGLGGDGLAGAGFADDGQRLAALQVKGNIAHGLQRAAGGAEGDL